jgi:hypothetical protein
LRSPALMSICSKTACYAVLASLSGRYPPLEGRSPTCYSPVCHSTCPLRGFRVRLACVRHAASVDSEPGSNSHVKEVGQIARLTPSRYVAARSVHPSVQHNCLTRGRCIGSALFNPFVSSGSSTDCIAPGFRVRTELAMPTDCTMPLADTHCLSPTLAPLAVACSPRSRERLTGCVCLHALSSFQRTDRRCARGAPQGCCDFTCSPGPNPAVPFVRVRSSAREPTAFRGTF